MYKFCIPEILSLDVPSGKIRREVFGPPKSISRSPGWPVEVREDNRFTVSLKGGKSFPAMAGEPLLVALERSGIVIPSLCRSGECSQCRVKLLSGRVYQPEGTLVRRSDRQHGYIHSCAAYPLEDLEILL
jgi:ferredoxin